MKKHIQVLFPALFWLLLAVFPGSNVLAAVTYVATSAPTPSNNTASSQTVALPVLNAQAVGDVLIAFVAQFAASTNPAVTTPAGWTVLTSRASGTAATDIAANVYYRVVTAADVTSPVNPSWAFAASKYVAGAIVQFRGVDTSQLANFTIRANAAGTAPSASTVTPVAANAMLLTLFATALGKNAITPPAGMTERFESKTNEDNGITIEGSNRSLGSSTAATGTQLGTSSLSSISIGFTMVLEQSLLAAPGVVTQAASAIGPAAATLNASVTANGASTAVTFDYGTVSGSFISLNQAATSGSPVGSSGNPALSLTGLSCGTAYYFRARGTNSVGSTTGADLGFTTSACTVTAFSAYESNIGSSAAAVPANRVITTRVASTSGNLCANGISTTAGALPTPGKTCSLTVAAFDAANALVTSYNGSASVKLQYCTSVARTGSGASSSVACNGNNNWADVAPAQNVALSGGLGVATFGAVGNAYEVVRVSITSAALALTSNAGDYFAIRPAALSVSATDAGSSTAGSTRSLGSGANSHKAGRPFTLSAVAHAGSVATPTSAYRGTGGGPVVAGVATTSPTGTGQVTGTLALASWTGAGTLVDNSVTYSEVGTVSLTLEDRDFANVDLADSTSAERYFSGSATVGRFTPDHFTTTVTPGCGATFTYSGQPFTTLVVAYNGLSPPTTTSNYALAGNSITLSNAGNLSLLSDNTLASAAFSVATAAATSSTTTYTFAGPLTAPVGIVVRATDDDGITSLGYETSAGTLVRSGRIRLRNAYGSELLVLPVPVDIQYYSPTGWAPSVDSCTQLTAANFAFSFPSAAANKLAACTIAASMSGAIPSLSLNLTRPGAGNSGWTDLVLNLGSTVLGTVSGQPYGKCTAVGGSGGAETPANLPWLRFDWRGTGVGNPAARAAFGRHKGSLVYRRENY